MHVHPIGNPMESHMDYAQECRYGRDIAASAIAECQATDNYFKLTRTIRDMASQPGGVANGFLQAIAERAAK